MPPPSTGRLITQMFNASDAARNANDAARNANNAARNANNAARNARNQGNQENRTAPNQGNRSNAPNQGSNNAPNQGSNNAPNQGNRAAPNQRNRNQRNRNQGNRNQGNRAAPNRPAAAKLNNRRRLTSTPRGGKAANRAVATVTVHRYGATGQAALADRKTRQSKHHLLKLAQYATTKVAGKTYHSADIASFLLSLLDGAVVKEFVARLYDSSLTAADRVIHPVDPLPIKVVVSDKKYTPRACIKPCVMRPPP